MKSELVTIGHGSGGRLTQELTKRALSHFDVPKFQMEDCAFIDEDGLMAVSMDGFTVYPPEFPGGDIGKLSVCGSANDLAVRGVKPLFLTMSLILEEGLDMALFDRYMASAAETARGGAITLIAGDTKVVPKGAVDGIFIATCAIGKRASPNILGSAALQEGDALVLTTAPGRHGAALAAARFGLDAKDLESDCALLWPALEPLLKFEGLRSMRDCTRGGLGTALCEWAETSGFGVEIEENAVPSNKDVAGLCDILGFDPLYLASEGCAIIAIDWSWAKECATSLKENPISRDACVIGRVTRDHPRMVGMKTKIGGLRFIDMPVGELLPRIC